MAVAWMLKLRKVLDKLRLKRKELLDYNVTKSTLDGQMKLFKLTQGGQSLSLEDLCEAEMAIVRFNNNFKMKLNN